MKETVFVLCVLVCAWSLTASGQLDSSSGTVEIELLAAASLTDALDECIREFSLIDGDSVIRAVYGSSGTLRRQIEQGAPADLFISAAPRFMDELEQAGMLVAGSRLNLLKNTLVLVVTGDLADFSSLGDLVSASVERIALGDPASVPAGQYALEALKWSRIDHLVMQKAVLAKDVRQVLAWVETGAVDAGFVYSTDALMGKGIRIAAECPPESYPAILYPAALVASGPVKPEARRFLAWLGCPAARAIFRRHGFGVP